MTFKPILMNKVKKEFIERYGDKFEFHLRNISINGVKKGCSGFIVSKENGKIVYLTTETFLEGISNHKILFRTAQNLKDFTGGINRWVEPENMYEAIMGLLS